MLALASWIVAISAALARAAVARPDVDVIEGVVRWGGRVKEIPPVSLSAAFLQFLLGIATVPLAKLLSPSVLYQPELGPSAGALLVAVGVSVALAVLVYVVWFGRVEWGAPREQQREAEDHA